MGKLNEKLPIPESLVLRNEKTGYEVRVPAFPQTCSYVRIVRYVNDRPVEECYWDQAEWQDDPSLDAFGAIMGAIECVARGLELGLAEPNKRRV
jgi:hypothetical protein